MADQFEITQKFVDGIEERAKQVDALLLWIKNFKVTGADFTNKPDGASLSIRPPKSADPGEEDDTFFDAIITDNTQDGTKKRWYYGWQKAELTGDGYDDWGPVSNADQTGNFGDSDDVETRAMNQREMINSDSGITGIGVDLGNLPDGFEYQPIPDGSLVTIKKTRNTAGKLRYMIIGVSTVPDGTCNNTSGNTLNGGGA